MPNTEPCLQRLFNVINDMSYLGIYFRVKILIYIFIFHISIFFELPKFPDPFNFMSY